MNKMKYDQSRTRQRVMLEYKQNRRVKKGGKRMK
jgi:hypothetical protein